MESSNNQDMLKPLELNAYYLSLLLIHCKTSGFHDHNLIEYIGGEEQNKYIKNI